jgi:hypothetical protein
MGEAMRSWFPAGLTVCLACSDGSQRSGTLPEAADFLPMVADSAETGLSLVGEGDTVGAEQPRLVLRCEDGRLGAYVVLGTPGDTVSEQVDDHAVVVRLDSATPC